MSCSSDTAACKTRSQGYDSRDSSNSSGVRKDSPLTLKLTQQQIWDWPYHGMWVLYKQDDGEGCRIPSGILCLWLCWLLMSSKANARWHGPAFECCTMVSMGNAGQEAVLAENCFGSFCVQNSSYFFPHTCCQQVGVWGWAQDKRQCLLDNGVMPRAPRACFALHQGRGQEHQLHHCGNSEENFLWYRVALGTAGKSMIKPQRFQQFLKLPSITSTFCQKYILLFSHPHRSSQLPGSAWQP